MSSTNDLAVGVETGVAATAATIMHLVFVAFVMLVLVIVIVSAYGMTDAEDVQAAHHQKIVGVVLLLAWSLVAVPTAIWLAQNRLRGYRTCVAIDGIAAGAAFVTALHAEYGRNFFYACSVVAITNAALLARIPTKRRLTNLSN